MYFGLTGLQCLLKCISHDLNDVNESFSLFGWFAIWFTLFGGFPILKLIHDMNSSKPFAWFAWFTLKKHTHIE